MTKFAGKYKEALKSLSANSEEEESDGETKPRGRRAAGLRKRPTAMATLLTSHKEEH